MATVHPRPTPPHTHDSDGIVDRFARLVRLVIELGIAETRDVLITVVTAIAVALVAGVALIAAVVVLLAGAMAPIFGPAWEPFIISGGGVALLSLLALGWSAVRLKRVRWPRETMAAIQETWRWLGTQTRSRLTSR